MSKSTPITAEQALQFFQAFLIRAIDLTDHLEQSPRAVGRMEAYQKSLGARK